eukprot:CAMPEP_0115394510 /NCGR_PEP_ID=MMETSP0271-20121206/12303_1 /TAXON_ID=71861 /ORGANISM="Scrippsiella trochoidea, Strain CCMP3099" /LENGTH=81 /DNA_ID=CAMNT_0002818183 /DNA_START=289 /DNA_END=534 /DNA_ORIENTATION=-
MASMITAEQMPLQRHVVHRSYCGWLPDEAVAMNTCISTPYAAMAKLEARVSKNPTQEKPVSPSTANAVPPASNIIGGMSDM